MLFQLHSPMNTNDIKRAIDEIRLLLIEQEVTLVSDAHLAMTVWCGNRQLDCVNIEGQFVPVRVDPYPEGGLWMCHAEGKFRLAPPVEPKRTTTFYPEGRVET